MRLAMPTTSSMPAPRRLRGAIGIAAIVLCLMVTSGCGDGDESGEVPSRGDLRMADQPRHDPYDVSVFFADGKSARPLVPGVVPATQPFVDRNARAGTVTRPGELGDAFPAGFADTPEKLAVQLRLGQQKYDVFCSVCHGLGGHGDGMIVQRGFTPPPSFIPVVQDETLNPQRYQRSVWLNEKATPRHYYDVITHGIGAMYGYAERIDPADRWAIVAYVKLLQAKKPEPSPLTPPDAALPGDVTRRTQP